MYVTFLLYMESAEDPLLGGILMEALVAVKDSLMVAVKVTGITLKP